MKKDLNLIRESLSLADENVLDVRSDMENDIRDYMIATGKDPLEVEVEHEGEVHRMTITITPLDEDGDGDADLKFSDARTGIADMDVRDPNLSTDLLAGICIAVSAIY